MVPVARVDRRIGRALTSTLRDAATSHGETEPSGNGGVEKARIDVLPPDEAMPPFSKVASATIMSVPRSDGCVERALSETRFQEWYGFVGWFGGGS